MSTIGVYNGGFSGAQIDALLNQVPSINNTDKKTYVVAGVIRYSSTSDNWEQIGDAHIAINSGAISCPTDDTIRVAFDLDSITNKKVISFICGPDEQLSGIGLVCGASVATTGATIHMTSNFRGYIGYYSGAWQSYLHSALPDITLTWSTDHLVVTVPWDMISYNWVLGTARGYNVKFGAQTTNTFEVYFYDSSGNLVTTPDTSMQFYFDASRRRVKSNGTYALPDGYGNIWYMGLIEGDTNV